MHEIQRSELIKIPFLDHANLGNRALASLTFYVDGEWHFWVPAGHELIRMKGCPAEGFYFADEPESPKDGYLHFLDFIAQSGNSAGVARPLHGLMDDFFNLGASLKKFTVLLDYAEKDRSGISRLVVTELEYLFALCRSIFDLLQEVIAAQWSNVQLLDTSRRKKQLPESFAKMVLDDNRPRASEEIVDRFRC